MKHVLKFKLQNKHFINNIIFNASSSKVSEKHKYLKIKIVAIFFFLLKIQYVIITFLCYNMCLTQTLTWLYVIQDYKDWTSFPGCNDCI